jgi:hypothetical protein
MYYDPERLRFYVEKRIQTTMIGALARIENTFGHLWGQDKEGELTREEEEFADAWDFLRNDILNYGNKQIRQVKEDFYKYGGLFKNTYNYTFKVRKDDSNEN